MRFKNLLVVFFALFTAAPCTAQASACQTLNDVLTMLSISQSLQTLAPHKSSSAALELLTIADNINLSAMTALTPYTDRSDDINSVVRYIEKTRNIIASPQFLDARTRGATLMDALPHNFANSLQRLSGDWQCQLEATESIEIRRDLAGSRGIVSNDSGTPSIAGQMTTGQQDNQGHSQAATASAKIGDGASDLSTLLASPKTVALLFLSFIGFLAILLWRRFKQRKLKTRELRRHCYVETYAQWARKEHSVTVLDITQTGAKLMYSGFTEGQRFLRLELDGRWHKANVVWSNKSYAGIRFKQSLPLELVKQIAKIDDRSSPERHIDNIAA